jgi:hypothetical protein
MNTKASASARTRRTPINGRNVLTVTGKEPGYVYRVVNDVGDRIQQFVEAGYELVNGADVKVGDRRVTSATAEGSKAQVSVGGRGEKAFVMRIKEEWYKEDQAAKQAEVNKLEQSITKNLTGKADYGSVKIEQGT